MCIWLMVFAPAAWFRGIPRLLSSTREDSDPTNYRFLFKGAVFCRSVCTLVGVLSLVFISTQPWFRSVYGSVEVARKVERPLTFIGMWTPNVYTLGVLKIADRWAVIYRTRPGTDSKELVPVNSENGERMSYLNSDILFYGNLLPVRRRFSEVVDADHYLEGGRARRMLEDLVTYDARRLGVEANTLYEIEIRQIDGTNLDLTSDERFKQRIVERFSITVDASGKVK